MAESTDYIPATPLLAKKSCFQTTKKDFRGKWPFITDDEDHTYRYSEMW